MQSILITNDDGIRSDGIVRLAGAAKVFGEVWVIAPENQRSAASHSITLREYIDLYPFDFPVEGVHAYSCSGTPADCIRAGCLHVMPDRPDLVLSGINYGFNVASDIQYSATAGAAFEAAYQGIRTIALSEEACDCHEVTDAFLHSILEKYIHRPPQPGHILNINFPGCTLSACRGILENRSVSRGAFYRDSMKETGKLPGGGIRLVSEGIYNEDAEAETDFRAVVDRYISVSIVNNIGF